MLWSTLTDADNRALGSPRAFQDAGKSDQQQIQKSLNNFKTRAEGRPSCTQAYLNRHINDAKGNDDDSEDGSGHADHNESANYAK